MIPADLLDKLREKDPELWERYKQWSAHMDIYDETALQYILQGELQEAIRARGWGYEVKRFMYIGKFYPGRCLAIVYQIKDKNMVSEEAKADTEASALLRAYLQAIGD